MSPDGAPVPANLGDLRARAFALLAEECESTNHSLCGGGACSDLMSHERLRAERDTRARLFDAGHERLKTADEQPSHEWSTAALVRTATDLLVTPPTRDPLWRSIAITTALARLGERGLPADPLVRSAIGPTLTRKILGDAAFYWTASREKHVARRRTPGILRPWLQLLDEEQALVGSEPASPGHAFAVASAGRTGQVATRWLQTAAIGHIVGWRIDGYLEVDRSPEDVVLQGGKDATRWVLDRFTKTYPEEWHKGSLSWELVFNRNPADTAAFVGVPLRLLEERVVTERMLVDAFDKQLKRDIEGHDELDGGLDADTVIAALGSMLEQGVFEGARAMARSLHEAHPRDAHLAMAYAFCTIPIDRRAARSALKRIDAEAGGATSVLREVNLAICSLLDGDRAAAEAIVRSVNVPPTSDFVWLWDPECAFNGSVRVRCEPLADWVERFNNLHVL